MPTLFKNKKILYLSSLLIAGIVIVLSLFIFQKNQETATATEWYDESWYYRKAIEVGNGSGSVQTDVIFPAIKGLDVSGDIDAGKLQADLDDIRFTDASGNLLDYFVDDTTATTTLSIWVRTSELATGTSTIYMYYGNPDAGSVRSSGGDFFTFFEGFDGTALPDGWVKTGSATVSDGRLAITSGSVYYDSTVVDNPQNYIFEYKGKWTNNSGSYSGIAIVDETATTGGNSGSDALAYNMRNSSNSLALSLWGANGASASYNIVSAGTMYTTSNNVEYLLGVEFRSSSSLNYFVQNTAYSDFGRANYSGTWSNPAYVWLGYYSGANASTNDIQDMSYDWIRVRPYNANQPTITTPASEEQGPGPVGYWSFDDGVGNTARDMTVNSNDGTITGATWKPESECVSGKCLYFDGTDDGVTRANFDVTNSFTVSLWFKRFGLGSDTSDREMLMRIGTVAPTYGFDLRSGKGYGDRHMGVTFWGSDASTSLTGPVPTDSKWTHVELVFDHENTTLGLYIDGVLYTQNTSTASGLSVSNQTLYIGEYGTNHEFNGLIDEVKIYNYARTPDQIRQDYNKGKAVFFGSNTQNDASLTDGLVGYWKFDEASANTCTGGVNDACDSSGLGNNGAWNGNASATTTAKFGRGVAFDGTGDYVSVTDDATLDQTGNAFSMAAWINYSSSGSGERSIMSKGTWAAGNYQYRLNASNQIVWWVNEFTPTNITSNTTLSADTWYHTAVVYDGEYMNIFINGELDTRTKVSGTISDNSSALHIGARSADTYFNGLIDEVRIYNRALNPEEVRKLYEYAPGPQAYWKFDENSGTATIYDFSGNGHTGTMGGFTNEESWINGKYGSALNFNSSGKYINAGTVNIGETWTISAWSKFPLENSASGYQTMVRYGSDKHHVLVQKGTGLIGTYDSGFYSSGFDVRTLSPGWHYVTAVGSGASTTFYVDGILRGTAASKMNEAVTTVGNTSGGTQQWGGLDELKIYNYARTQKQILEDMMAGRPNNPVAYYSFDEMQGTTAYDRGYLATDFDSGNNGTLTNMSTAGTSTAWTVNGKKGGALQFDGVDDTLSSTIDLSTTETATVSFWFKFNDDSGSVKLLSEYSTNYNSNNAFLIAHSDLGIDGSLQLNDHTTSGYNIVYTSQAYNDNQWHHFVGTIDRSKGISQNKIYIDGELDTVQHATYKVDLNGNFGGSYPLYFGSRTGSNYFYNGLLDEVKIYNYALSLDEIRQEYNSGAQTVLSKSAEGVQQVTEGLVGWWKMDEASWAGTSGEVIDSSGAGNHGTGNGSITSTSTAKYGRAGEFDGVDDYILTTDTVHPRDVTMEAWVYLDDLGNSHPIFSQTSGASVRFNLYVGTDGKARAFFAGGSPAETLIADTAINAGSWNHIVLTWTDYQSARLYVNGSLVGTHTISVSGFSSGFVPFRIGYSSTNPSAYFDGEMDDVKIYNYARTPEQIMSDYVTGPAPIGYWKFDDMEGTSAVDSSGSGNTGTITSATWNPKGKLGSALEFDGVNDKVDLGTSLTELNPSIGTVSLWAKPIADTDLDYFISLGGACDGSILLRRNSSNLFQLVYKDIDNGYHYAYSTTYTETQNWNHYLFTWDEQAQKIKFYRNGALIADHAWTVGPLYSSSFNAARIGHCNSDRYYKGLIDEVKIYNYALSARQVAQEYNGGGPVAWYKFDKGEGGTAYDYSPSAGSGSSSNGNDGTITIGGSGSQTTTSDAWTNGANGKLNGSLNFDGTDDWVLGQSNLGLSGDAEFTMMAWIKWSGAWNDSNYPSAMGINRSVVNTGLSMTFRGGRPALDFWSNRFRATDALTTDTWYHVAMTKTPGIIGSTSKIYVNGMPVSGAVENSNVSPAIVDSPPVIGRLDATRWFKGQVDEAKFFNYALTPDEIKKEYNSGFVNYFK